MPGPVPSTSPRSTSQYIHSAPSREQNTIAYNQVQDPTIEPIIPINLNNQLDEMTDDLPNAVPTFGEDGVFESRPL
jgi:hypothetical protein